MAESRVFLLASARPPDELSWRPAVDVYRGARGWLVKCDLAGVDRDDIEVLSRGRRLTIRGLRRDWSITEGHRAYSIEIAYNRFSRTVEMPCELDQASIHVDYRDGMLLITITDCPPDSGSAR